MTATPPRSERRRARSQAADERLRSLWESATSAGDLPATGVALVAVGGYGRRQLSPQSDLDVVLLASDGYDDPALVKGKPYLPVLKESILKAKVRPVTPNYNAVTLAIQKHSYAALQGQKTVDQAIKDMAAELDAASKRS